MTLENGAPTPDQTDYERLGQLWRKNLKPGQELTPLQVELLTMMALQDRLTGQPSRRTNGEVTDELEIVRRFMSTAEKLLRMSSEPTDPIQLIRDIISTQPQHTPEEN